MLSKNSNIIPKNGRPNSAGIQRNFFLSLYTQEHQYANKLNTTAIANVNNMYIISIQTKTKEWLRNLKKYIYIYKS